MQSQAYSNLDFEARINKTKQLNTLYNPVIFNTKNSTEKQKLADLLNKNIHIQIFDSIEAQIEELIKCLNPGIQPIELKSLAKKHLGNTPLADYGLWVYYPWSEKLVHLLDEEEFVIVRTNRNKHKITAEEQLILSKKKIGVMGLSVGQSVSLTLAIERGFGELRIADFDELDLSNLNRIRTGVHNIHLQKTVIVAREIAEMDPYLKVICFHEGITEQNIDAFLTENGKLDLLIDECDSFDVKISAREKAKTLQIPVLMEGSDRCTIDIERFDLEPDRPVLHGYVSNMDMSVFKTLKSLDEKLPYIAPVTGVETLSPRMKASAIEIMTTISTWPQLASAVTYGGGITADLSRKILLGSLKVSGRFFIDIDELITDEKPLQHTKGEERTKQLSIEEIENYLSVRQFNKDGERELLSQELIRKLITAAGKAPSGGNNQPWHWHYEQGNLHLFMNKNVSGAYLDPDYISSYTSLGASIENLLLEAAVNGLGVTWKFTPEHFPEHIALFNFKGKHEANEVEKSLAAGIGDRHTNRKTGLTQEISTADLEQLKFITETENIRLQWLTGAEDRTVLGDISGEADLLRMFIPAAHEDFIKKEMRWNKEEIIETEDGIGINTLDLSNNDQIGLRLMKDEKAVQFLKKIKGGLAFKKLALKQFQSSPAIGLITLSESNPLNYLKGGMAVEKMWLAATALGYQIHPVNVPLIFFYKNNFQELNDLPEESRKQIFILHQKFKHLFKITDNIAEIFLFRIFKAESSPQRTIRKPLNKTLSIGTA
ncbi:Rv1355c family protein [Pedobacter heparinus]|uniref:UBA/THIF-type NAD/FAD binding protein n=1 Tax=Pedobacter heparinus (strain ATCC 13125 / DSM 2366 / CIP 104194 / JCM 7457 / NBRC 12017 / NCIMB 9290 / NRRL B-14731 / HIM 762-3) TaxID=485917 RepID=C6XTV5_PEDHD|nr:Rv1355c family protein [Pedobacter heparinus]ACU03741.1 UBA/THIF-type NAD/FAD binding protein [Pedobacter heparinus DSM 2366]